MPTRRAASTQGAGRPLTREFHWINATRAGDQGKTDAGARRREVKTPREDRQYRLCQVCGLWRDADYPSRWVSLKPGPAAAGYTIVRLVHRARSEVLMRTLVVERTAPRG